jgi:O-antigen/teichoic acid export membrane protein
MPTQRPPDEPVQEPVGVKGARDSRIRRPTPVSSANAPRLSGGPALGSAPHRRSTGPPVPRPSHARQDMPREPIGGNGSDNSDGDSQLLYSGLYARQMAGIAALIAVADEVAAASRSSDQGQPYAGRSERARNGLGKAHALLTLLRQDHMMRDSLYLMLNAVLQAGFGFSFWIIAARLFSASEVGRASALISASGVIGFLALLGLNNGMGKYLPTARDRDALISAGLAAVAICGVVIAVVYIFLTPLIAPRLAFVEKSPELTAGFALITAACAVNALTDSVFIASRRAKYSAFVDGVIGGTGKNILAFVLAGAGTYALFLASTMGTVLAACASIVIIFTIMRCKPRLKRPLNTLAPLLRFSAANYVGNVFNMVPTLAVPIIVLDRQGAAHAAYFFVVFQCASIVYAASFAIEQTFLAEGSRANSDMRRLKRRSLRVLTMLCVPAALCLIAGGRWLLLAFGGRYYHYGFSSLVILALAAGPISANYWLLTVLRLEGKLRPIIVVNCTYAVAVCTLAWVGASRGLTGVALGWLAGGFIAACVAAASVSRKGNARHSQHAGHAARSTSARALPRNAVARPPRNAVARPPRKLSISNLKQKAMGIPSDQRW